MKDYKARPGSKGRKPSRSFPTTRSPSPRESASRAFAGALQSTRPPPAAPREPGALRRALRGVRGISPAALVFGAALLWLAAGLGFGAYELWRAPLREVVLEGNRALTGTTVLELAGLNPTLSMQQVDPYTVAERVRAHPRVVAADVRRVYPGQVHLRLTERQAELRVLLADGRTALVDREDVVLSLLPRGQAPPDDAAALPIITTRVPNAEPSTPLSGAGLARARAVLTALQELGFPQARQAAVDAGDPLLVRVRLADGAALILPPDQLESALRTYRELAARYPELLQGNGAVDLTTLAAGERIILRGN